MISSDPVVASPDSSFISSPDKTPLISKDKAQLKSDLGPDESSPEKPSEPSDSQMEKKPGLKLNNEPVAAVVKDDLREKIAEGEDQSQLLLSVPDLIYKDNLDSKQKLASSETRMASTPCPGKGGCRISVSEGELMGNGAVDHRTLGLENEESHPDLLSFE